MPSSSRCETSARSRATRSCSSMPTSRSARTRVPSIRCAGSDACRSHPGSRMSCVSRSRPRGASCTSARARIRGRCVRSRSARRRATCVLTTARRVVSHYRSAGGLPPVIPAGIADLIKWDFFPFTEGLIGGPMTRFSDHFCRFHVQRRTRRAPIVVALVLIVLTPAALRADQVCPSPTGVTPLTDPDSGKTCNPSSCTQGFCTRGDIAPLGQPATQELQDRLVTLDCSPHSIAPVQVFAEADPVTRKSQLFQYYLLDNTGFQPSVFTTKIPGVNDDPSTMRTVWGANCGLPTTGAVRVAVEPKPGLPADPDNPRAFIDIFTDIRGLFVINNESGWYEGWMIHDLRVAPIAPNGPDGHALYGTITPADARELMLMGTHNNLPGRFFTVDGRAPHLPSPTDVFPTRVANVVPIQLSMSAYNAL